MVLAILAILAGLLLPVLASIKVKGNVQQATCMDNLKQISMALAIYGGDNQGRVPSALNFGNLAGGYSAFTTKTYAYTYTFGGLPKMLTAANPGVFRCPSDKKFTNSIPPGTNDITSYKFRWVVWYNTALYPGLKNTDFIKPAGQVVYHENYDFHNNLRYYNNSTQQPILNAIFDDGHVQKWAVTYKNGGNMYDPNWFYYGNQQDVKAGWDIQ